MRAWLGTALLVGLVGLAACGGGSDAITGPPPTLTGSWLFTDSSLQGEAQGIRVNCGFTDLRLELTQNGSELTGTHSAATATCSGGGRSDLQPRCRRVRWLDRWPERRSRCGSTPASPCRARCPPQEPRSGGPCRSRCPTSARCPVGSCWCDCDPPPARGGLNRR